MRAYTKPRNHEGKREEKRDGEGTRTQEGRKEGRKGTWKGREPTEGAPISIIVIIHLGLFPANAHSWGLIALYTTAP